MKLKFAASKIFGIERKQIKKIHWLIGHRAFLIILILIFLALLWGVFIFYQYVISVEAKEQTVSNAAIKFDYAAYQEVLKAWQAKDEKFQRFSSETYSNPFMANSAEILPAAPEEAKTP